MKFWTAREIFESSPEAVNWVVKPFLADGVITELNGKPKSAGKTTFALAVCKAVLDGGDFLGKPVRRGRIIYLTEESRPSFQQSLIRAGIADGEDFHVLFWKETLQYEWPEAAKQAVQYAKRVKAVLLVVDTIAQFARLIGETENHSGDALQAIMPLQLARDEGLAVLEIRHQRKQGGSPEESGRGSSAFSGAADIILSLQKPDGNHDHNVRMIRALSRFDETPDSLTIKLEENGYSVVGTGESPVASAAFDKIQLLINSTPEPGLTLEEIIAATGVSRTTAQDTLERLDSEIEVNGKGVRRNPKRYYRKNSAETLSPRNNRLAETGKAAVSGS